MSLVVRVKDDDEEKAKKIAAKILEIFGPEIKEVYGPFDTEEILKKLFSSEQSYEPSQQTQLVDEVINRLTYSQLKVLVALCKLYQALKHPVSTERLARYIGLSRNLTSNYLKRLFEMGLVEREYNLDINEGKYGFIPRKEYCKEIKEKLPEYFESVGKDLSCSEKKV